MAYDWSFGSKCVEFYNKKVIAFAIK